MRDERPLQEIIDDPAWKINDSITMIKHHALRLVGLGAIDMDTAHRMMDLLPERPELPWP